LADKTDNDTCLDAWLMR